MKKALFYPALVALILTNVFVYSCQKEDVASTVPAVKELATVDRSAPCSPLMISNGVGLGICNIDNGTGSCVDPCNPGSTTNVPFEIVGVNPQNFAFLNSNVFSLTNPGPNPRSVGITAGVCAGIVAVIPAGATRIFKVTFNPATGCCVITPGC
jgi:hypothetical protein